jgi:hypothetical protein
VVIFKGGNSSDVGLILRTILSIRESVTEILFSPLLKVPLPVFVMMSK